MGVKHLWTVLAPFCDRKPLYELQGKTVAVDLSCWICEAQNIAEYQVQPRMYLRNLYFRTCYLLLLDVNVVFVLEGKAPELKYDTISARNAIQFKGAKPKTNGVKTGKDRTRFHFVLRQCEEMLGYMGIACIKGNGEAESLCAYLNEDGLVDGCISQDSDCFAYGAQVVYRNFSISTQGTQSASGGAVDIYDIRKVTRSLNIGRNKIVAMALLIGSDYSDGVHGVGKDSVLKFFETVSDEEVLDRLRSWRTNVKMYENHEKQLNDKNICSSCGHSGKIQGHTKNGCNSCKTKKGCDPFKYKDQRLNIKNEVNIRNKAMQDPTFPNETLIKEFLDRKDHVKHLDLSWKQPSVVKFLKFTTKFLQWEELYAFEKILPVLTRWQCRYHELLKDGTKLKGVLKPERIKKVRNPKGVPSYEIIWSDPSDCFKGLIPENQILDNNIDLEKLWSTIEPQQLVETAYPELVDAFKQSKIKPKKLSKRKKKNQEDVAGLLERLENVSISEPKLKKPRKPRAPKIKKIVTTEGLDELNSSLKLLQIGEPEIGIQGTEENQTVKHQKNTNIIKPKTLDSFVQRAIKNSYNQKHTDEALFTGNAPCKKYSTPVKPGKKDLPFYVNLSSFGDESDLDVSDIIEEIVSRKSVADDLKRVANKYFENTEIISLEDTVDDACYLVDGNYEEGNFNSRVSFFMKNPADGQDLFEKTFNDTFKNFDSKSSSGSDTEEYYFDDVEDEANNAFSNNDVPLAGEKYFVANRAQVECLSTKNDDSFCY